MELNKRIADNGGKRPLCLAYLKLVTTQHSDFGFIRSKRFNGRNPFIQFAAMRGTS
jgi:hypothetical protein